MTDAQNLYNGITKAAWGYFFLYFDINLGSVSILPSFVGYCLFLSAINCLKEEEKELSLLLTLVKILAVWHAITWLIKWIPIGIDMNLPFITLIINVINLYFHFQLLTNLSYIAERHQVEGVELDQKLLQYRTLQTVMLTIVTVMHQFSTALPVVWGYISTLMGIMYLVAGVCLIKALLDLRKCLPVNFDIENDVKN